MYTVLIFIRTKHSEPKYARYGATFYQDISHLNLTPESTEIYISRATKN